MKRRKELKETTTPAGEGLSLVPDEEAALVNLAATESQVSPKLVLLETPDSAGNGKADLEKGDQEAGVEPTSVEGREKTFGLAGAKLTPYADPTLAALAGPSALCGRCGPEKRAAVAPRSMALTGVWRCEGRPRRLKIWLGICAEHLRRRGHGLRVTESVYQPRPSPPYLMDHAASRARAAELSGIDLRSDDEAGELTAEDWLHLTQLAGMGN